MRRSLMLAIVTMSLALAGCNDHSLTLALTPNPLVVGLLDTKATVHAHAVARGLGAIPVSAIQFAVYNGADTELASQTETVDRNIPSTPFGIVIDKDFTFPINAAIVALSGMKYITVRVLDSGGSIIAQQRLDVVVHALKDVPVPPVVKPTSTPM